MKASIPSLLLLGLISSPVAKAETEVNRAMLGMFQPIMEAAENPANPLTDAKVDLGRMLYYDTRLSKNRTVSCNSCHDLASFGDDGLATSKGIDAQLGGRSAPTVYNAAIHIAQFWDGRAADVEAQAVGPILNPIEMGMPDEAYVLRVLKSIPGYVEAFAKAFPEDPESVTYANVGKAIGAFERKLMTPSKFDDFLKGDEKALTDAEKHGLNLFVTTGCTVCHNGMGVGGHLYQKLGLVKEWPTKDLGRFAATKNEADKYFFKVPSLRNITETAPYLHDGSIASLEEMVAKMAEYQLGRTISAEDTKAIVTFLGSLKGRVDENFIKKPELPADGPDTPKGNS
ncbi:MAG: cytochrome-c peroxidase [Verrucomicrobiales bacterium]|jgi:cytochrome c peroxidase|nr:cytochrome-c peroxidase [Verrucomicrobiales bacterium]